MNAKQTFVAGVFLLAAQITLGVMVRHDVPEGSYRDLAARPGLQAGLVRILDPRGDFSGVLISPRHILTCGHPVLGFLPAGKSEGPMTAQVRVGKAEYETEHAWLHPRYDRQAHFGGSDLAILRLKKPGVAGARSARVWTGGIAPGDRFVGVGQGRSGTGRDNDEPLPMGLFRGYENTVDYQFDDQDFTHFRADFDDGTDGANTLARVIYGNPARDIPGRSAKEPLPLEGTPAAGDSGSGIWIQHGQEHLLAGITSYRYYSMYGGQAGYANLSHPAIVRWLAEIARAERVSFGLSDTEGHRVPRTRR